MPDRRMHPGELPDDAPVFVISVAAQLLFYELIRRGKPGLGLAWRGEGNLNPF